MAEPEPRPPEGPRRQPRPDPAQTVLEVRDLRTHFATPRGTVRAVDGVSFTLRAGGRLGIVGESGSGKSITALSIMRLIEPPGRIVGGEILFRGRDLATLPEPEMRRLRGQALCLVFQDPMSALNPVYRVGSQVAEMILAHNDITRAEARKRTVALFRRVGIPDPERRIDAFPHNMSGGMLQRVTIAMAMANEPDLLILDEPTTALDVTIQAQILDLTRQLVDTSVILITHDVGVIEEMSEEVVVMYGGRVMEHGTVDQVVGSPLHPYTVGLVNSIPSGAMRGRRLNAIAGSVPSPLAMPPGCPFSTRCPMVVERCAEMPPLALREDGRKVACWRV